MSSALALIDSLSGDSDEEVDSTSERIKVNIGKFWHLLRLFCVLVVTFSEFSVCIVTPGVYFLAVNC